MIISNQSEGYFFSGIQEDQRLEKAQGPFEITEGEMAFNLRNRYFLNLLCLGNARMLSSKATPYVNEVMRSLGLKAYDPDLTELLDRGGGPHCLTFELERDEDQRQLLLQVG